MTNNSTNADNSYFYFTPKMEIIPSIKDKDAYKPYSGKNNIYIQNISELYAYNLLVVLSEPGNGKSRLLKQIVLEAEKNNYEGFYLDLKKCDKPLISDKLNDFLKRNRL